MSSAAATAASAAPSAQARLRWPRFTAIWSGRIGLALVVIVVLIALLGPLLAPYAIDEPIGAPGVPPSGDAFFGTDFLGRDVLSRTLHGGFSVITSALITTFLIYLIGTSMGMLAGYTRSIADPLLMRTMDLIMGVPPLLLLLVLIAGAGTSPVIVVLGVVIVLTPPVARLVRSATLEASTSSYVEAAKIRGESRRAILFREILPNISPYIVANLGITVSATVILTASLSFLGLGARPPAANWGLMVAENQPVIATNVWALLPPAIMLALITVGVNLIGDAYSRTLGRSGGER